MRKPSYLVIIINEYYKTCNTLSGVKEVLEHYPSNYASGEFEVFEIKDIIETSYFTDQFVDIED